MNELMTDRRQLSSTYPAVVQLSSTMNDTTLPKKRQPRTKQPTLRPGFGLNDWLTLLRHAKDLSQRRGAPIRRSIPLSEVRTHNKPYDGWMILRGKVYNIAPYLQYHPGGSEILEKCLGRDATRLFDRYHSWVNLEGLIGPLLLGYVEIEKKGGGEDEEGGGYLTGASSNNSNASGNEIVLPSVNTATSSSAETTSQAQANIEFSMPKPRPPKGSVVPSLLGPNNDDDEKEEELL